MDIPANVLGSYHMDERGEAELEFYWVTNEFIDLMESMMRNFVAFQHPNFYNRRFAILSVKVYWDHDPQRIMQFYGGPPFVIPTNDAKRNMDVVVRETA